MNSYQPRVLCARIACWWYLLTRGMWRGEREIVRYSFCDQVPKVVGVYAGHNQPTCFVATRRFL